MNINAGRKVLVLICIATVALTISGCGQRPEKETETQTQSRQYVVIDEQATEHVTETETQKLVTAVDYTSKDGSIKITLPDNTWKVTQDADEMRVFQSGSAAIINIVHASTPTAMKNLSVLKTEEELNESLKKQYADEDDYEIEEFTTAAVNSIKIYRYLVRYTAAARMWAYSITSAIISDDEAYIVTGTVTDENSTLLAAVQTSVQSFRVLGDEDFRAATGEVLSGTTQKMTEEESETENTATASGKELTTLKEYAADATLVTSDIVNVRLSPGTDAAVLTTLSADMKVTVTGETTSWFQVSISGNTGYIRKDFLVYGNTDNSSSAKTQTTETEQAAAATDGVSAAELATVTNYGYSTTLYATDIVNVRGNPGTDSDVIDALSTGDGVAVVGETDNWFVVTINGNTGYVSKALLASEAPSASDSSSAGDSGSSSSTGSGGSSGGSNVTISGQVTYAGVDTLTIQGNDGNTYYVYYGDASVSTSEGLDEGVSVVISADTTQTASDGTLYAVGVSGN